MSVLEMLEQDLSLFETDDPMHLSPLRADGLEKVINLPPFLTTVSHKKYQVSDQLNLDNESPFNPMELLGATNHTGQELAEKISQTNTEPYIPLPYWKVSVDDSKLQLDFCHDEQFKNYVLSQPMEDPLEKTRIFTKREQPRKMQEEIPYEDEEIANVITEEERDRVEKLNVSEETKKLLIEKYFRSGNHPELEKIKVFEKNPSALFYELFSVSFREKPIFEIESTGSPKGPNEYTAYHVFNGERLGSGGRGSSKKDAKSAASLISLEIFAPSLAERCKQHSKQPDDESLKALITDLSKPLEQTVEQIQENMAPKKSSNSMEVEMPLPEIPPADLGFFDKPEEDLFYDKDFVGFSDSNKKLMASLEPYAVAELERFLADSEENKPCSTKASVSSGEKDSGNKLKKPENAPQKGKNPDGKEGEKSANGQNKGGEQKEMFNIKCDSVNGLKIGMSIDRKDMSYNRNILEDIKTHGRMFAIKKVYDDLQDILKTDRRLRVDFKANYSAEIGRCLKYYCVHNVFTKLYILHCLANKREDQTLQLNALYYDRQCYIYLFSSELDQTFMYHSESFIMSIEMAKYFLVFTLYKDCRTIHDILETLRPKMDLRNDRTDRNTQSTLSKSSNSAYNTPVQQNNYPKPRTYPEPQTQKENISKASNTGSLPQKPVSRTQFQQEENSGLKNRNSYKAPELNSKRNYDDAFDRTPKKKNKLILDTMADDIDDMFSERTPVRRHQAQPAVQTIKDQMFEDLDNI